MSDEKLDLDAIEARANAATPGPWVHDGEWKKVETLADPPGSGTIVETDFGAYGYGAADLAFIAAARQDVPALVAEVRRLRSAADAARREERTSFREEIARRREDTVLGRGWDSMLDEWDGLAQWVERRNCPHAATPVEDPGNGVPRHCPDCGKLLSTTPSKTGDADA